MSEPLAVVEAVRRASLAEDGADPLDEAAVLHLKNHGLDGARLWTQGEDGFALRRDGGLDLAVAPAARGRGVGGHLAAQALEEPGAVAAWSHGDHPAAARLAARHGLERVRDLWVMRRPAATPLPPLEPPPGVRLRGWTDGDGPAVLRVNAAAFASHPEQGGMDAADLAERMAEPWFDPEGLILAVDEASEDPDHPGDPALLAFHWTKQHSPTLGEVYVVAVAPQAQGRGLGRTVTLAGLHHLHDAGVEEVHLYVESDNRAAVHTYSRLGFGHDPADTHVMYRRG